MKNTKALRNSINVCVIGYGSWGTTLSLLLAREGISVTLTGRNKQTLNKMRKQRENKKYLAGFPFHPSMNINEDMNDAVKKCTCMIVAVPSYAVSDVAKKIKLPYNGQPVLLASKGIHGKTMKTNSQTLHEIIPDAASAVLSGPNLSYEMACGKPAASVVAAKKKSAALYFQKLLSSSLWRIYTQNDVKGVELGGALKNIYAIGCGMNDGLQLGANARAAFLTRGLAEMTRLGKKLGAKEKTFYGLSGAGDMMTTSFSSLSRNFTVGWHLAHGKKLPQIIGHIVTVAEGVTTTKAAFHLAKKTRTDAPIIQAMYKILFQNKPVKTAITELMQRTLKHEER